MKVIHQFAIVKDDKVELLSKLARLEQAIKLARLLLELDCLRDHEPEPLKFLEHDYDLVLGNFGIDFLPSHSASVGQQTDPAAVPADIAKFWGDLRPPICGPGV